jgi:hypothetical protein
VPRINAKETLSSAVALVRTPDLFIVARYLKNTSSEQFAADCRKALADTCGAVVISPKIPETERPNIAEAPAEANPDKGKHSGPALPLTLM